MMIRTYVDTDFDQLLDLTIEVFGPFFEQSFRPAVGPTIFHHEHADWREDYRRQLTGLHDPAANRFVVVAEEGGELVGFTAWRIHPDKRHGEIEFVAVRASARRSHVGTQLCELAFDAMRRAGAQWASLGTGGDDFHAPARRLYDRLGMTPFPSVHYYKEL